MARRILFLIGPEYEDIELLYPLYRLQEEGYETVIAAPTRGSIKGKVGYSVESNKTFDEVDPAEYDALVLPGGRGPERIRNYESVKRIVRYFIQENKPVAAICHGPQVLISAGVLKGRRLTSTPSVKDDVVNAGGEWIDQPVVVDGNLVTARIPADIPAWMREFTRILKAGEK
ncbi:MAG: type 1 glutamine amidotransferase [Desulfurococcus sp.]|nr:type 1 glutamine amidotransferase [Desulfurococcus sp.]